MATYDFVFQALGLEDWCTANEEAAPMSMSALTAQASGEEQTTTIWELPFPSMDSLNEACDAFPQSRNVTLGLRTDSTVQVTEGLSLRDTVITSGIQEMRAGLPVQIERFEGRESNPEENE